MAAATVTFRSNSDQGRSVGLGLGLGLGVGLDLASLSSAGATDGLAANNEGGNEGATNGQLLLSSRSPHVRGVRGDRGDREINAAKADNGEVEGNGGKEASASAVTADVSVTSFGTLSDRPVLSCGPAYHFLVVDDSDMNRKMVVRALCKLGHSCAQVEDGQQAVNVVRQHMRQTEQQSQQQKEQSQQQAEQQSPQQAQQQVQQQAQQQAQQTEPQAVLKAQQSAGAVRAFDAILMDFVMVSDLLFCVLFPDD
jgi:CheY-like chemotaxis protein